MQLMISHKTVHSDDADFPAILLIFKSNLSF